MGNCNKLMRVIESKTVNDCFWSQTVSEQTVKNGQGLNFNKRTTHLL